jgi:hypothetical protein
LLTGSILLAGLSTGGILDPAWAALQSPGSRAFGLYVGGQSLSTAAMALADTGDVMPGGAGQGADLHSVDVPGVVTADVLTASAATEAGVASSETSLADLTVLPGRPAELTAAFVRARANVLDVNGNGRWEGVTEIRALRFAGRDVVVSGQPNQRVDLAGVARLIVNEQIASTQGGVWVMTVNALHLVLATGDEFVVAGARSALDPKNPIARQGAPDRGSIASGLVLAADRAHDRLSRPPALPAHDVPECHDFVTGGGWFAPRYEGGPPERVNFGFNAGYRTTDGELKGHVNFVDHNDGTHIEGVDVDTYARLGDPQSLCRMFEGDATVDGVGGYRYHVEVCDYGEPGRDDRFRILVYAADGTQTYFADDSDSSKTCAADEPRCGDLDGGNIQIHKNCDAPAHASTSVTRDAPSHT